MAKFKLNRNMLLWIVGILFIMSVMPGEGTKAASQEAIVSTDYTCNIDSDCPKCVGKGLADANATAFPGELSYAACVNHRCDLSEYCLVWDCGNSQLANGTSSPIACKSVKRTLLDNTLVKLNQHPMWLFIGAGLLIAFMLAK